MMSAPITETLLGAVADRRTKDLRFRQRQLTRLHEWIVQNASDVRNAITTDEDLSNNEAGFVLASTLDDLRRQYDSLDLRQELNIEFRIKQQKDGRERRQPEELVYIIPDNFTAFFSTVSALGASIVAGCCCVVEVCVQMRHASRRYIVAQTYQVLSSFPTIFQTLRHCFSSYSHSL
jgi:acyl-CoA reductase-like NAD-dependent aldehyde dehydrogenase